MLIGNMQRAIAVLKQGLASPEHRAFIEALAQLRA